MHGYVCACMNLHKDAAAPLRANERALAALTMFSGLIQYFVVARTNESGGFHAADSSCFPSCTFPSVHSSPPVCFTPTMHLISQFCFFKSTPRAQVNIVNPRSGVCSSAYKSRTKLPPKKRQHQNESFKVDIAVCLLQKRCRKPSCSLRLHHRKVVSYYRAISSAHKYFLKSWAHLSSFLPPVVEATSVQTARRPRCRQDL